MFSYAFINSHFQVSDPGPEGPLVNDILILTLLIFLCPENVCLFIYGCCIYSNALQTNFIIRKQTL